MLLSLTFVPAAVALFVTGTVAERKPASCAGRAPRLPAGADFVLESPRGAVVGGAAVIRAALRPAGHALGDGVHPESRRRGHRHACHAHSRHQPHPVAGDAAAAGEAHPAVSRSGAGAGQDRTLPKSPRTPCRLRWPTPSSCSKPRDQWPDPHKPKEQLVAEIEAAVAGVPGNNYEFTQPIQMRMNELIAGVRAELAIKIYGDRLEELERCGPASRRPDRRRSKAPRM